MTQIIDKCIIKQEFVKQPCLQFVQINDVYLKKAHFCFLFLSQKAHLG